MAKYLFESVFLTCSFGYRPHIGALDAIKELSYQLWFRGYNYVVEADIKSFFDNINHDLLMEILMAACSGRIRKTVRK